MTAKKTAAPRPPAANTDREGEVAQRVGEERGGGVARVGGRVAQREAVREGPHLGESHC